MGQVRIEYSNGIIVYVNRHPIRKWTVNVGNPNGWFNFHVNNSLQTGRYSETTFTLPPNNGWVVYNPIK